MHVVVLFQLFDIFVYIFPAFLYIFAKLAGPLFPRLLASGIYIYFLQDLQISFHGYEPSLHSEPTPKKAAKSSKNQVLYNLKQMVTRTMKNQTTNLSRIQTMVHQ